MCAQACAPGACTLSPGSLGGSLHPLPDASGTGISCHVARRLQEAKFSVCSLWQEPAAHRKVPEIHTLQAYLRPKTQLPGTGTLWGGQDANDPSSRESHPFSDLGIRLLITPGPCTNPFLVFYHLSFLSSIPFPQPGEPRCTPDSPQLQLVHTTYKPPQQPSGSPPSGVYKAHETQQAALKARISGQEHHLGDLFIMYIPGVQ